MRSFTFLGGKYYKSVVQFGKLCGNEELLIMSFVQPFLICFVLDFAV